MRRRGIFSSLTASAIISSSKLRQTVAPAGAGDRPPESTRPGRHMMNFSRWQRGILAGIAPIALIVAMAMPAFAAESSATADADAGANDSGIAEGSAIVVT